MIRVYYFVRRVVKWTVHLGGQHTHVRSLSEKIKEGLIVLLV